jgi:hypothetical protein
VSELVPKPHGSCAFLDLFWILCSVGFYHVPSALPHVLLLKSKEHLLNRRKRKDGDVVIGRRRNGRITTVRAMAISGMTSSKALRASPSQMAFCDAQLIDSPSSTAAVDIDTIDTRLPHWLPRVIMYADAPDISALLGPPCGRSEKSLLLQSPLSSAAATFRSEGRHATGKTQRILACTPLTA